VAHPMSVDRLDLGDHVCWTFDDDGERLDGMARFVSGALGSGHKLLYATASLTPDALLAGLRARSVEVDGPAGTGQLRVEPVERTYLAGAGVDPDRAIDGLAQELHQAVAEGYHGVRIVADMAWARAAGVGLERLMQYEELVNTLFAGGAAVGLCQYDRRLFPAAELHRAGTAHPGTTWVEDDSAWVPLLRMYRTLDPPRLRLVGEVDMSNLHAFAPVLWMLRGRKPNTELSPLVVDASELTFADASAAGLLVTAARAAPAGLQVRGCTPAVARTLEVIGARTVPGMAVTEETA
jgi:anti-anti-sigma regulatory factor